MLAFTIDLEKKIVYNNSDVLLKRGVKVSFAKLAVGIISRYMRAVYRPRFTYADKETQSERFTSPTVIIANHTDHKDALFLLSALKGDIATLTARDWCEKPVIGKILIGGGCIPCDRGGLDTQWLREARDAVSRGRSVLIFPEGRTRTDGELNEFKSGFAMLSAMTGAPVVCVGLSGKYRAFHRTYAAVGLPQETDRRRCMDSAYLKDISNSFRQEAYALIAAATEKRAPEIRKCTAGAEAAAAQEQK